MACPIEISLMREMVKACGLMDHEYSRRKSGSRIFQLQVIVAAM